MERLDRQMRFVAEIGRLKGVVRQTVLAGSGLNRPENSAEHSWHLAMMALVLDQQARQEIAERAAADRIFAILPADQETALRQLWDEFNDRQTREAKFARAVDRLQPMLENLTAGGGTWQRHGVTADRVLAKVRLIEDGSATLRALARNLIAQAVAAGILAPSPA